MTGIHFEGPAPRPLERFKIGLANDGQVLVDKTKSYKWEKGEWENPDFFLKVLSLNIYGIKRIKEIYFRTTR